MIIHNATIHSPVERFATAVHIEHGVIVWLGDEDTAGYRSKSYPEAEVVDADRALITPAFHNTWAGDPAGLHAQGVTAAHIAVEGAGPVPAAPHLDVVGRYHEPPAVGPAVHVLSAGADHATMAQFLAGERVPGAAAALTIFEEADLQELGGLKPERPDQLLYVSAGLALDPALLLGWNVVVVLDEEEIRLPLADLAAAGVPYALGGHQEPWQLVTRTLFDGPAPISARAAFNALTRGAWRLTPGVFEPRGVIRVGAAADLAVWHVEVLAIQAPDEETAFWSTDERAGTPLLPALGEGEAEPRLTTLLHGGVAVHDSR